MISVRVSKLGNLKMGTFCRWRRLYSACRSFSKLPKLRENSQENCDAEQTDGRRNVLGIQMLSASLHKQIFKDVCDKPSEENVQRSVEHLKKHGLWGKETSTMPETNFRLPQLFGDDIDQHFHHIATQQSDSYRKLATKLASAKIPPFPKKWIFEPGWTRYNFDGTVTKVDFPDEQALIVDVEVLVTEGPLPTIATAVSDTAWYSWCSDRLIMGDRASDFQEQRLHVDRVIPLENPCGESSREKIVIGHNVSYDRVRIRDQYFVKKTKTRFLDTMSLHIAISGLTGLQRALLMAETTGSKRKEVEEAKARQKGPPVKGWMKVGSLNNLADVYRLHCGGNLKKEQRETFVKGNLNDVLENFQDLMSYCAKDVKATHEVLAVILPVFFKRFPHPVTFAGMLEMSCAYLPANQNWVKYINSSQSTYERLENELKLMLIKLADDACELLKDNTYKNDPWLWDMDWSIKKLRKKTTAVNDEKTKSKKAKLNDVKKMGSSADLPKEPLKNLQLEGYPKWYRKLCPKPSEKSSNIRGPTLLSLQMQVTPKLLRLTWDGYPLHYTRKNGWGYLVPGKPLTDNISEDFKDFPISEVEKICSFVRNDQLLKSESRIVLDELWEQISEGVADPSENSQMWRLVLGEKEQLKNGDNRSRSTKPNHHGNGPYLDEDFPGFWFFRLPHKDGPHNKVGNPLAKDFLSKIEDGTLQSKAGEHADWALKMSKMISYWRNAHKRITSQTVVWLRRTELPETVTASDDYGEGDGYGAIIPQIVTAGTVTRRAVEATWLTASNAYADRVGSELKGMIQTFPGYHFVGADVDSQELWIAAILGDAHFAGMHGCTAFGWMTLQGKKSNGTDMHSKTAATVGITRDQAKIINYGRIYGAGQTFATRLLMQFNHRLTSEEAKAQSQLMYAATKGVRGFILNEEGQHLLAKCNSGNNSKARQNEKVDNRGSVDEPLSAEEAKAVNRKELYKILRDSRSGLEVQDVTEKSIWMGGTESSMFNKLEEIAMSLEPKTPVLSCRISRALEPSYVMDNFMTSRVNWVVQSSAVDYLHLMLVCMEWLFEMYNIDGRFCISIHDEVRYLVKSEDRHRAALALQIANLLTRSMFAFTLGMNDLPQSVAFFSAVDIDKVMRKEVNADCVTPSNALGLEKGYGIPKGEALDIYSILQKTNGSLEKSQQ